MTGVEFHSNVPDKLGYACRLLRKAALKGAKVAVTGEPALLRELDTVLWTFDATEFVPHCLANAPAGMLHATPIVLCDSAAAAPHHDVLVNLGSRVPEGFERFERLIEVVTVHEDDKVRGRERWKHYKSRGYDVQNHDREAAEAG